MLHLRRQLAVTWLLIATVAAYDAVRLWQSVVRAGINDAGPWYGALTGAEDEISVQDLWNELGDDESTVLELLYETSVGVVEEVKQGARANWFELNGKRYSGSDDSFYLQSGELDAQRAVPDAAVLRPGEGVVGTAPDAPIVVLYGQAGSEEFEAFNWNLYREAQQGRIRLVWRPTCEGAGCGQPRVGDIYAHEYSVKEGSWDSTVRGQLAVPSEFAAKKYRLGGVKDEDLSLLDLKVATLIAEQYNRTSDFTETLEYARQLIDNFPLLAEHLVDREVDTNSTEAQLTEVATTGVTYDAIGLYINGQPWKLSSLDMRTFVLAIISEQKKMQYLMETLQSKYNQFGIEDARQLLSKFCQVSVVNAQDMQPARYDFHRVPGFSESVIYFNDIEKDPQYSNMSTRLDSVFEKSDYGVIPSYRKNWNELVFVVDFDSLDNEDTREILSGMVRAFSVADEGYPQRIGLLPMYHGDSNPIVEEIYRSKESGLANVKNYLRLLVLGERPESEDSVEIPPVKKILEDFSIFNNSLLINGQIHPFKKNTWHYLIASTLKHDVEILKSMVGRFPSPNVRELLHSKSLTTRDSRYIVDYFDDATYTVEKISALAELAQRVTVYEKGEPKQLYHTVTLVDDFESKPALQRLKNLLQVKFNAIRIRLIHIGVSSTSYGALQSSLTENKDLSKTIDALLAKAKESPKFDTSTVEKLEAWVPDLTREKIAGTSSTGTSFAIINGRYIQFGPESSISKVLWESLLQREATRTLDLLGIVDAQVPGMRDTKEDADFVEQLTSILSYLFYSGSNIFHSGIERTSESTLPRLNILDMLPEELAGALITNGNPTGQVELAVIVDPLEERSQTFLRLVDQVKSLSFLDIRILLLPTKKLTVFPIHRIYSDDVLSLNPVEAFDVSRDVPHYLYPEPNNPDVASIIIEGYAFDEKLPVSKTTVESHAGVCLELLNADGEVVSSSSTMSVFGYFQFLVPNLGYGFTVRSCSPEYEITSFSTDAKADYVPSAEISIIDVIPHRVFVKLRETHRNAAEYNTDQQEGIHIYVTIHDPSDEPSFKEKLFAILAGTPQHTPVTFWLAHGAPLSPELHTILRVAESLPGRHVACRPVRYAWPSWLRPQRFVDRRLDAARLLFLDTALPHTMHGRLIMLSLTEERTPDVATLSGLQTTAYLTMRPHRGHGYWEEGYWQNYLGKHNLRFYNPSRTFVVDLDRYRSLTAGDHLRVHYQRLSADVTSLLDIDQDLVNSVQLLLKIRPLRINKFLPPATKEWIAAWPSNSANDWTGNPPDTESASEEALDHDEL
ncbi:AaceriADR364Wp [[Ashbya] aceris (nom. inval.)]|nr:AaceriADR364Wp [[Ashbya] aceris (nom. inval.)]